LSLASAQAQSLADVAKREKERRSKLSKADKPARTVDESGLSQYHKTEGDEGASRGNAGGPLPPVDSGFPERRPPLENPNRSRKPSAPPSSSSATTAKTPPRDPTLGPQYVEDHLYGEENLRRLRREATSCLVEERASSPRCKELDRKAKELERLLRERRNPH
jgi:hypothetical protein